MGGREGLVATAGALRSIGEIGSFSNSSKVMRAVRTETHLVVDQHLVVADTRARTIGGNLNAEAAEFARRVLHKRRGSGRIKVRRERVRIGGRKIDAAARQPVVAKAGRPARHELIDRLRIATVLLAAIVAGRWAYAGSAIGVEHQCSGLAAREELGLDLQVLVRRIAFGRPLVDQVRDPRAARTGEQIAALLRRSAQADRLTRARRRREKGDPGAPTAANANVAAGVRIKRTGTGAVAVVVAARETATTAYFNAEIEIGIDRREPAQLQTVIAKLAAEKCLVYERAVDEIPDVCVLLVQVADTGEIAASFDAQAVAQGGRLKKRLLDRQRVVRRHRHRQRAGEVRINVGGQAQFRFRERKSARSRTRVAAE